MDYLEAKTKMEFGLVVLGYGDMGYHLVTEQEWKDTSNNCDTKPHLLDSAGRICGDCKIFYIADARLEAITDKDLVPGIDMMAKFFREGSLR